MDWVVGIAMGIFLGVLWAFLILDAETLNKINTVCANNQQIEKVTVDVVGHARVRCKDGATFRVDK